MQTEKNRRVIHIKSSVSWRDIDLAELYEYRELIWMLVKRYFTTVYKQTILGPLWIVLNPFITTVLYSLVFGAIARISTDGVPHLIFYMAGTTLWGLFSTSVSQASNTFLSNVSIFSKVYFPRLASPIAASVCACINYAIQFVMFLSFYFYYLLSGSVMSPNRALFLVPVLILQTALLGMGVGTILAALTIKYRDLNLLTSFALQLWMYATPVIYPASATTGRTRIILMLNPMSPIMEAFRYAFVGTGELNWTFLGISMAMTVLLLIAGVLLFNHTEKTCVDIL